MIIVLPILILLTIPLVIAGLRSLRPGFSYYWLLAAGGALLAWIAVMAGRLSLPKTITLANWQISSQTSLSSPVLLLDEISWPFALTLASLTLATILTEIVQGTAGLTDQAEPARVSWTRLCGYLLLAAGGLPAVLAGNLLTLTLAWVLIDGVEFVLWLGEAQTPKDKERLLIALSQRLFGTIIAVWAIVISGSLFANQISIQSAPFTAFAPQVRAYLLLAAGLRLGVLPFSAPLLVSPSIHRGKWTMLRLAPAAASLPLIARLAGSPEPIPDGIALLFLCGLAALLSSLAWAASSDEITAGPYWVPGVAALALACGIQSLAAASLAWGVALLLAGGMLFLFAIRLRWLIPIPLFGALLISSLPFTPTWPAVGLYASPFQPLSLVFLASQALVMGGFLVYVLRAAPRLAKEQRWVWVIYPLGLALLPVTQLVIAWWNVGLTGASQTIPSWRESWPALIVAGLSGLYAFWRLRRAWQPTRLGSILKNILALEWFYRPLGLIYEFQKRLFVLFNRVLEGRAGILWSLLILILLISILAQAGLGG
jgi:hypothetical protein